MDNKYQDNLDAHIRNMTNLMFTFEVTKCCGYSTFISIYKEKTLLDLYEQVIDHFEILEIKELFFYAPSGQRIKIPISKQTVNQFVKSCITGNSVTLVPLYPLPSPIIYRLYLDYGECHDAHDHNHSETFLRI
jgi:hypothetical protein